MLGQNKFLKYSSVTLSAIIFYWAILSHFHSAIPAPTLLLRTLAALVGTALLVLVCAPLDVHMFWAIIHLSPFLITAKASDPMVDAVIVTGYGLFLVACGGSNPYTKLEEIVKSNKVK